MTNKQMRRLNKNRASVIDGAKSAGFTYEIKPAGIERNEFLANVLADRSMKSNNRANPKTLNVFGVRGKSTMGRTGSAPSKRVTVNYR